MQDVAAFLPSSRTGDDEVFAQVYALAYDELRRLARRQLGGAGRRTLVTTVLVNEAFVKLVRRPVAVTDRVHFFALAARAMRQVIIDHARERQAGKRGGALQQTSLDLDRIAAPDRAAELIAIDAALAQLDVLDPRLARIVEWRFFGGMTEEEVAEALGVTARTVRREWQKARAFLLCALAGERR